MARSGVLVLTEQRAAIEGAGSALASWVELLGQADVDTEHLDAARKVLGRRAGRSDQDDAERHLVDVRRSGAAERAHGRRACPAAGGLVDDINDKNLKVTIGVDCRCALCRPTRPVSRGSDAR